MRWRRLVNNFLDFSPGRKASLFCLCPPSPLVSGGSSHTTRQGTMDPTLQSIFTFILLCNVCVFFTTTPQHWTRCCLEIKSNDSISVMVWLSWLVLQTLHLVLAAMIYSANVFWSKVIPFQWFVFLVLFANSSKMNRLFHNLPWACTCMNFSSFSYLTHGGKLRCKRRI